MWCCSCYPCHCFLLAIMVFSFQNYTTDRKLVSESADFGTGHCQSTPADPCRAKSADTSPESYNGTPHRVHSIDTPASALVVPPHAPSPSLTRADNAHRV